MFVPALDCTAHDTINDNVLPSLLLHFSLFVVCTFLAKFGFCHFLGKIYLFRER